MGMSFEGILFLLLDLGLLGALAFSAFKMPRLADAPAGFDKAPVIIGLVGLARGLWRCFYLPTTLGFLFRGAEYMDFRSYLFTGNGIVADICLVTLGLLLAHRALAAQLPEGHGVRKALESAGGALYKLKGVLGAIALISAIVIILPHLPQGGGGGRRRRRW
jgi:hypothetical protein